MLSRPTTEQLLLDCRDQLLAVIDPGLSDPNIKIAVQMLESVLRNCATRAAHEIAWMHDETSAMVAYAQSVAASAHGSDELSAALAAHGTGFTGGLHLDETIADYASASECLSTAVEAAMAAGNDELHLAGRALLEVRLAHENEITGAWTMVGRG
jgi:hypothetical protein